MQTTLHCFAWLGHTLLALLTRKWCTDREVIMWVRCRYSASPLKMYCRSAAIRAAMPWSTHHGVCKMCTLMCTLMCTFMKKDGLKLAQRGRELSSITALIKISILIYAAGVHTITDFFPINKGIFSWRMGFPKPCRSLEFWRSSQLDPHQQDYIVIISTGMSSVWADHRQASLTSLLFPKLTPGIFNTR